MAYILAQLQLLTVFVGRATLKIVSFIVAWADFNVLYNNNINPRLIINNTS